MRSQNYHVFLDSISVREPIKKRAIPFSILTEDEGEDICILDTVSYCIWRGLPKGLYASEEDISLGIIQGLKICTTTRHEILMSNYTI